MKTLYLIRHAESEANRERLLAGQAPYPLSPAGRKDARAIAEELRETAPIGRIISSPLLRARQTAACFSRTFQVEIEEEPRLSEQNMGTFTGMSYDAVKGRPGYQEDPLKRWDWVPPGGGESYRMIARRVEDFFRELAASPREEETLIVTHAVTFRLIRGLLEDTLPLYPAAFPNNGEIWRVPFREVGEKHPIASLFLGESRRFVHNP